MPDVNLLLAFVAGVLGFLSPCIVPLIPGYLSFVSGLSLAELSPADRRQHRVQVVLGTVVFVIGFASVFTALGASDGTRECCAAKSRMVKPDRWRGHHRAGAVALGGGEDPGSVPRA